jgi:hypothetical protein
VRDSSGEVGLVQIDAEQFLVTEEFRFSDEAVLKELTDKLESEGRSPEAARQAVDDARTISPPRENPSDLASIPRFIPWFDNAYGLHTLAAIIHDQLIVEEPNAGALGSDTLSDRFFREMLQSAGVPWLKRWIIWAAVALRTGGRPGGFDECRCACGSSSRSSVSRHSCTPWGRCASTGARRRNPWRLLVVAVLLPLASAPLWGRQFGASLVAAVAALWVLPAALFAAIGYLVYQVLESVARRAGLS